MKCLECNGKGEVVYYNLSGVEGDTSYEYIPCDHCGATGIEPPDEDALVEMAYLDDTRLSA